MPGIGQTVAGGVLGTRNAVIATTPFGLSTIANYLEDDWGDNSLTSRSSTEDGVFVSPSVNVAGDMLIGRYRPEWNLPEAGSWNTGNGEIEYVSETSDLMVYRAALRVNVGQTIGSWKVDIKQVGSGSSPAFSIFGEYGGGSDDIRDASSNLFLGFMPKDGSEIRKYVGGSITLISSSTVSADENYHTRKINRDSYGNFEHFYDGTSQGTATDTFLPPVQVMGPLVYDSSDTTAYVYFDNLVVQ